MATKKNVNAQIREQYGWTQEQSAAYLGVSRSHLSLHELGKRMLPAEALGKWREWKQFTHANGILQTAKAALNLPPTSTEKLLQQAENCEWEAQKWQRKLIGMQKKVRTGSK